jgi:hypothetical protein
MLNTLAGILCDTGLPPSRLRPIVGLLVNFVRGSAQTVAEAGMAAAETGLSDEEWWISRAGELSSLVPDFAERFPMAVWIESDRSTAPGDAARENFLAGLDIVLDGIG